MTTEELLKLAQEYGNAMIDALPDPYNSAALLIALRVIRVANETVEADE